MKNNIINFADYVQKSRINQPVKMDDNDKTNNLNLKQEWQVEVIKHLYAYAENMPASRFQDVLNHIQLSMITTEVLAETDALFDGHSIIDILDVLDLTKQFMSKMYMEHSKSKHEKDV